MRLMRASLGLGSLVVVAGVALLVMRPAPDNADRDSIKDVQYSEVSRSDDLRSLNPKAEV